MRTVTISVSNQTTGDTYLARSYPHDDIDGNGKIELYRTPVYYLHISAKVKGKLTTNTWKALRFMPYYNNPKSPSYKYKARGFISAGLWRLRKRAVSMYNPRYGVQNTFSPYAGAIQMRGNFLIHAGPIKLTDSGWGSAGCVEVIGDFGKFKQEIATLAGITGMDADRALLKLVRRKRLFVEVLKAKPPKFKGNVDQEVKI